MNTRKFAIGILMLLGVYAYHAGAADANFYVIAHPEANITVDMLRDIYVGDKQFAGATKVVPTDNASLQSAFLARALKLDQTKYDNLWIKKSFRDALNPPAVKGSDREVIDFVKKNPGAIGYISQPPPAGVVLVQKY